MFLFLFLFLLCSRIRAFNPLQHSGPASPYFDAPSQAGISPETPDGCIVDQAAYILRHGSRFPEPGSFSGWQSLFAKFQNTSYTARGPLSFIPFWVLPVDDQPHEPLFLSSTGAGEAFDLGVQLRKRYGFTKGGGGITVWSAAQQRVLDTATYFIRGYLSQGNYLDSPNSNRGTVISLVDSATNSTFADSLTPSASCPLYAAGDTGAASATAFRVTYQQAIANRLNEFLDGLVLTPSDIGVMQDLCGFGFEVSGDRRFCDVFQDSEWLDYEYAQDLNYYYGSGPGNPLSVTVGYPWVKAISDLFVAGPGQTVKGGSLTPPPLVMGFTHDNNLPPIISALGLWNTSKEEGIYPLSHTSPNPARQFRSSYLVAFRGYVALERLTCAVGGPSTQDVQRQGVVHLANVLGGTVKGHSAGQKQSFVRVRVDNAPVPIPTCTEGPGSTCPLTLFTDYVNDVRAKAAGDFIQKCGLVGVEGATSTVDFLTQSGDGTEILVGLN
ncbi:phosphoglycerate mutase-like protein [Mycena floridula]|nr:phosphoglycerate mutase-like protein [Mycena floridula]